MKGVSTSVLFHYALGTLGIDWEWHPQGVVQAIGFTNFFEIPHRAVDLRPLPFVYFSNCGL